MIEIGELSSVRVTNKVWFYEFNPMREVKYNDTNYNKYFPLTENVVQVSSFKPMSFSINRTIQVTVTLNSEVHSLIEELYATPKRDINIAIEIDTIEETLLFHLNRAQLVDASIEDITFSKEKLVMVVYVLTFSIPAK